MQERENRQKWMRILVVMLVLALTAFVAAGCSGGGETSEKAGTQTEEKANGQGEGEGGHESERSEQAIAQEDDVKNIKEPAAVYIEVCGPCHGHDGSGVIGPALRGTALTVEQIQAKVETGSGQMPKFKGGELADAQIKAVSEYVKNELK